MPLLWSLPRLGLKPGEALLEELMREVLADEMEAVRWGGSGILGYMCVRGGGALAGQALARGWVQGR